MTPVQEQAAASHAADLRARFKRRLNLILGWATLPIYVFVIVFVMMTWTTWPGAAVTVGFVILVAYSVVVLYVMGGVTLFRSHGEIEPTEWMRRGGLMAAPEKSAHPDEERIRKVLATLPSGFPVRSRAELEAYLALPDDDEKQLQRDRLIRDFYEKAASDKPDLAYRREYNELRQALSPWTQTEDD